MSSKKTIHVTCAIIYFQDKILVTQRSEQMKLPLKWEFPGGKLEENESEVDCIQREIKEEINIEIEVIRKLTNVLHDYGTFIINLIPFVCTHVAGEIKLTEHKDFRLLDKSKLEDLDWAAADIPIIEEILKESYEPRNI